MPTYGSPARSYATVGTQVDIEPSSSSSSSSINGKGFLEDLKKKKELFCVVSYFHGFPVLQLCHLRAFDTQIIVKPLEMPSLFTAIITQIKKNQLTDGLNLIGENKKNTGEITVILFSHRSETEQKG